MFFLEFCCFFNDPADIGNLISGSSAFSKSSLHIWKFSVHLLVKPHLENFELYFVSMWDECNCAVVWTFFGLTFLWDWNENWPFPVLWPLLNFPNVLAYWVQHLHYNHIQELELGASQVALGIKNPPASVVDARDVCSIPGLWRSSGAGTGNPLQYSFLENSTNRGAWWLQSMETQRVGRDWVTEHGEPQCRTVAPFVLAPWSMEMFSHKLQLFNQLQTLILASSAQWEVLFYFASRFRVLLVTGFWKCL